MPSLPSVSDLNVLPLHHQATIIPEYLDSMGHMNIQYYLHLYTRAIPSFYASLGMDETYFRSHNGFFTLNHCISYYAEVLLGETVAIHSRMVGYSAKRLHFMFLMVNETTGRLASTLEELDTHADLTLRRTSAFPDVIMTRIHQRFAADARLDWQAPLCGVLNP